MRNIDDGFRNYLTKNNLRVFVDLESLIDKDDGCPCQIVTLNKHSEAMKSLWELELSWKFESNKVVLVYNCESKECFQIPLAFDFLLPGDEKLTKFDFGNFSQIKRNGNQIILTQNDYGGRGYPEHLDVVIFDVVGKTVFAWKISSDYHDQKIDSFKDFGDGRWLVKFESTKSKKTLVLLTTGHFDEYDLSLVSEKPYDFGDLVNADINEIKIWFSDEKTKPKFMVIIGRYQLYAYSLQKYEQREEYKMMSKVVALDRIREYKVIHLYESFVVEFATKSDSCGDSNFFLSFTPKNQ